MVLFFYKKMCLKILDKRFEELMKLLVMKLIKRPRLIYATYVYKINPYPDPFFDGLVKKFGPNDL